MKSSSKINDQDITICKQCGSEFTCGFDDKSAQCWCYDLPNVMPLTKDAKSSKDCYCQKCLEGFIFSFVR